MMMELKINTIAVILATLVAKTTSLTCYGRPSLIQDYTNMCFTNNKLASFSESQSCLTTEITSVPLSCGTQGACTEVNIQISPGQHANSAQMIWSAASCFDQTMDLLVCSQGISVDTTTTESTTTLAVSNSAQEAEDMASTTEGSTSSTTTSTTSPTTTSTTTTSTTSLSSTTTSLTTTTTYPAFTGCLSFQVEFSSATCSAETLEIAAEHYASADTSGSSTGTVNVQVKNLGCCTEDNCRVDDMVAKPNTCVYGDVSSRTTISCASACFGYLNINSGTTTGQFGCIADVDLSGTSFSDVNDCSGSHADGTCSDVSGATECLKCCTGSSCNDWSSRDALLGILTTTAGASHLLASGALLLIASFLAICF
ncbi:uncharacterized protein [Watersipora subatra]|uniref:uncharacterized protein n=1 Tax=Watersipora subatra TaxID=2589382 RepID=UPI00355C7D1F